MSSFSKELYEKFAQNVTAVSGEPVLTTKAGLGQAIANVYKEAGVTSACVYNTPMLQEAGVVAAMEEAGITVHTDHIRKWQETDKGGVSEIDAAIADLGTCVQLRDDADARITAIAAEFFIGVIKGSTLVDTYDDMWDKMCELPEVPNFVGFITGPSRTADIECVLAIGVHGPIRVCTIVLEDA